MKTIILAFTITLFPITNLYAQWEILNEGFNGHLNSIDFVNDNVGWLAGSNGTLEKTTDGGENWNSIAINENWHIGMIDFFNESVGWAIGGAYIDPNWTNYIWKTTDGGTTWVQQFISTVFGFNSLYFIDTTNVFAVGGNKIYKTSNGGTNWINISPNVLERNYNSLWFQDSQTGVVVGNYNDGTADRGIILRTTNGGSTWNETIVNEFNSVYELQFLNSNAGYFRANLDTTHYICKTVDMLASWSVVTQMPYAIRSYQFLNQNLAYAIMEDSITTNNVMRSIDGGVNWQNVQSFNFFGDLTKIYFCQESVGFMYGNYWGGRGRDPSILYKSENTNSWCIQKFSLNLNDIYSFDKDRGIIIGGISTGHGGSIGQVFFTMDGGNTWNMTYSNWDMFRSCIFLNEMEGISLASWGIYKTSDLGINWNIVYENYIDSTGFYFSANEIRFMDQNTGWVVGSFSVPYTNGAEILGTLNGGESWELAWQFPDTTGNYCYNLISIYCTNSAGWTVGNGGMIVKYTQQTGWVKQTSVTGLPLNKVFFSNDNNGWIAGGYQTDNDFQKILLMTTNGGVNWNAVPNVPYLIKDIAFMDNNLGWAIGYTQSGSGGILKTTDGGITWVIDTGDLPAQLNSLFIKDNYGWAVGDNGLILRTTDAGAVWVEDENNNVYPTEFILEQNYPNPFNPSTSIQYAISGRQFVTLKVYDLLGREVATLVNEEQPAGNYEVEFKPVSSIKNPASGIYFYQLKTGSFIQTKKMVIIK